MKAYTGFNQFIQFCSSSFPMLADFADRCQQLNYSSDAEINGQNWWVK